jgi:hypothetical protein
MDPNHPTADDERPGRPPEPVTAVINGDQVMFLDCPACLDEDGALRCGLPAEVRHRFTMRCTDGPLEAATIRCPSGHRFHGPIQSLTWDGKDNDHPGQDPAPPAATYRFREGVDHGGLGRPAAESAAARAGIIGRHARLDGRGGHGIRPRPAAPQRESPRPGTAPASYLGRPARLWITAMSPRRRREPLAGARYRTGEDQPSNPARDAQPDRSRVLPRIANPAPASASKEDTS